MRNHTTTEDRITTLAEHSPEVAAPTVELPRRGRRGQRVLAVTAAATTALLLWLIAGPVLGINLDVLPTPGSTTAVPVTAGSVIFSSVTAGLLGWALLAGLERLSAHGATIWRWVAGAVALLSLGGPLTLAQSGGGTVVLTLLHATVAGILVLTLPGGRRSGTTRGGAGRVSASGTDANAAGTAR